MKVAVEVVVMVKVNMNGSLYKHNEGLTDKLEAVEMTVTVIVLNLESW